MKVDFAVIGAQKCATTSLAAQLALHEEVCFCRKKEPHFFSRRADWRASLDRYHSLFSPKPGQICGEASTSYSFFPIYPHVPFSLHAYNPDVKLVYLVRDPVERIISHYTHRAIAGTERKPFEDVALRDPEYVNYSRYGLQLRQYLKFFDKARMHVITLDDYASHPYKVWQGLADFLQIKMPGSNVVETRRNNVSSGRRRRLRCVCLERVLSRTKWLLPQRLRSRLATSLFGRVYKPEVSYQFKQILWSLVWDDVAFLERFLGYELDFWRRKYED